MPKVKRQRKHNIEAIRRRWSSDVQSTENSGSSSDGEFLSPESIDLSEINFSDSSIIDNIRDLFTFCKERLNNRHLSVLLYMSLRFFGKSWREIDAFLTAIGAMTTKSAHKWSDILINDDFNEILIDQRGGKRFDSFWDAYPDLEIETKQFVTDQCSKKEATFTIERLVEFIDDRVHEIDGTVKDDSSKKRSIESCRLDLRRFGAKYTGNKARPYFLGHERDDVVNYRQEFVNYFVNNQSNFYCLSEDPEPKWILPNKDATILICKPLTGITGTNFISIVLFDLC
jgi:hypothetical protein